MAHCMPSSAAAVAVATPCWPAPVSAMTLVLPIRLVSSAWASTLLILCDPVWLRSSRLRMTRAPPQCAEPRHLGDDARPAGVGEVQPGQLVDELGVDRGLLAGLVELLE